MPTLKQCETQALKLQHKERAILAEHLIASLDAFSESENENLWLAESEKRYKMFKKGKITARPAKNVLRDAYSAIK